MKTKLSKICSVMLISLLLLTSCLTSFAYANIDNGEVFPVTENEVLSVTENEVLSVIENEVFPVTENPEAANPTFSTRGATDIYSKLDRMVLTSSSTAFEKDLTGDISAGGNKKLTSWSATFTVKAHVAGLELGGSVTINGPQDTIYNSTGRTNRWGIYVTRKYYTVYYTRYTAMGQKIESRVAYNVGLANNAYKGWKY